VPVVFEKLAEQLRDPLFRTAESGYDPDDVRRWLDEAAARLAGLEARVAKVEAKAERAERRAAMAQARAASAEAAGSRTGDVALLDEVVLAGQRQAEEVVSSAHAEAARLRVEAVERAAAARASADDAGLRDEVATVRSAASAAASRAEGLRGDLEAVDAAVAQGRGEILAGLDEQLRGLAALALKEACR
jgi:cell division septum initiation protein DivIVA